MATVDTEPTNNSVNGCAGSSFARWLACFRWHDDGASVGVMIVGDRSPPDAVTWHSSIKKERPCSIRAGNGRRVRLSRLSILGVGCGRGQCHHKRDCWSRHDGLLREEHSKRRYFVGIAVGIAGHSEIGWIDPCEILS